MKTGIAKTVFTKTSIIKNYTPEITDLQSLRFCLKAAGVGGWELRFTEPWTVVCDDRGKELFGMSHGSDFTYDEALRSIHDDDRETVDAGLRRALHPASDGTCDMTYRFAGADHNQHRRVRVIGKVYFDDSATPARFSGIVMDVQAEKPANENTAVALGMAQGPVMGTAIGNFTINLVNDDIDYSPAFSIILTGQHNRKLTRKDFIDHIHPDDRKTRLAAYEAAKESGDLCYESRTIWDDGTIHRLRTVGKYTFNANRQPSFFTGTVQDITAEKEREQALREAEERHADAVRKNEIRYRNVASTSPTGLWMSDEQGLLTYLNKTLTDWTGVSYDSLQDHGWEGIVAPEDSKITNEAFKSAIVFRSHFDIEFRIRKTNSEVIWCRAVGDPFYRDDGSYAGYVGYCMDIHDRVVANNKLRMSEERMRSIIEQAPLAICLLSGRDMVVETANESRLKLWGKNKSIIGKPIAEAIPELTGQPFVELMQAVYDTGEPYYAYERQSWLERGGKLEECYFDFVYHPIRNVNGQVTGVMLLASEVTDQVNARNEIALSEERLRSLIEEAPYATALHYGPERIIEVANEAMIRLWGKDKSVIGKPLHVALPELEGQPYLQIMADVLKSGIPYHSESAKAQLFVEGELKSFYINFTYKPLRNKLGDVYAVLNMAIDVTEHVLSRRKLKESELFAHSVIDNSPIATIVFIGPDLVIKTVNENMLRVLGRDASITGKPFTEVMPELADTDLPQRMRHILSTGETYHQPEEMVVSMRDGTSYISYYDYTYKALPDTAGEFYGIICMATEVTNNVLTREKIREAEASLRGAIELAELGTWEVNFVTRTVEFSRRFRSWCGFAKNEVLTIESSDSFIVQEDRQLLRTALGRALQPGSDGFYNVEYRLVNLITGRGRIIHSQGKVFFNEKGEPYKVSGTAQDVTKERKIQLALEQEVHRRTEELQVVNKQLQVTNQELFETNERLVRSNEELEQYAFVTSHDLQEPLRKITTFSGMLGHEQSLTEESRNLLNKIMQSAMRMSMLIQDLLEFSRLMKSDMAMGPVDLGEICRAVTSDFELSIREKGAQVEIGDLPVVNAIALQMNQLLFNLMSNALKFVDPEAQPRIRVSCKLLNENEIRSHTQRLNPDFNYFQITFADNGIGFEAIYAEQIFEVFKRLHGRTAYPGSGIGLALCRRIVTNHSGYLFADSTPGKGTDFHILLPNNKPVHN